MSEPRWPLIEWEAMYGATFSVSNDNDTLVELWGNRFPVGIIRLYLANVEDAIDRLARGPYQTGNTWGDKRYGGPS